jgi:hypothetical protein
VENKGSEVGEGWGERCEQRDGEDIRFGRFGLQLVRDCRDELGEVVHLEVERERRGQENRMVEEVGEVGSSGGVGIEHQQEKWPDLISNREIVCVLADCFQDRVLWESIDNVAVLRVVRRMMRLKKWSKRDPSLLAEEKVVIDFIEHHAKGEDVRLRGGILNRRRLRWCAHNLWTQVRITRFQVKGSSSKRRGRHCWEKVRNGNNKLTILERQR